MVKEPLSRLGLKPQTWPYLLGLEGLRGPSGPEDGGGGPSGLSKLLSRGFKNSFSENNC
jgi:hypothetical protein